MDNLSPNPDLHLCAKVDSTTSGVCTLDEFNSGDILTHVQVEDFSAEFAIADMNLDRAQESALESVMNLAPTAMDLAQSPHPAAQLESASAQLAKFLRDAPTTTPNPNNPQCPYPCVDDGTLWPEYTCAFTWYSNSETGLLLHLDEAHERPFDIVRMNWLQGYDKVLQNMVLYKAAISHKVRV